MQHLGAFSFLMASITNTSVIEHSVNVFGELPLYEHILLLII